MNADEVNYTASVELAKAGLDAAHVDLSGPCGAFQITQRVAWAHRQDGAGLLEKTSGNNCQGYAVDIICFPDGSIADCLVDAGGENGPTWQVKEPVDPSRYRPAIDPRDPTPPDPPDPPDPPAPDCDCALVLKRLDEIEQLIKGLYVPVTWPQGIGVGSVKVLPYLGSSPLTFTVDWKK